MLDEKNWKKTIENILIEENNRHKLPEGSIYLVSNYGKENMPTSYSICIYEREYPDEKKFSNNPTRNTIIANIKLKRLRDDTNIELLFNKNTIENLVEFRFGENKGIKKGTSQHFFRIKYSSLHIVEKDLVAGLKAIIDYEIKNYKSKAASFGCCSRFNECSNMRECVHPNKLYACACWYKRNLEKGNIYYTNEKRG